MIILDVFFCRCCVVSAVFVVVDVAVVFVVVSAVFVVVDVAVVAV